MRNTGICPKCGAARVIRIPDSGRYANGNNIYTTKMTLFGKVPVIRYVCGACGYVEDWVENKAELEKLEKVF